MGFVFQFYNLIPSLTVIITHNAAMAEMADRILYLSDGKIINSHHNPIRLPASKLKW